MIYYYQSKQDQRSTTNDFPSLDSPYHTVRGLQYDKIFIKTV